MSTDITEEEYEKLKVFSSYLLQDEYKDKATFDDFNQKIGKLFPENDVNLEEVYKSICGDKDKSFTFPKIVKSFIDYKKAPSKADKELKKFYQKLNRKILWKCMIF